MLARLTPIKHSMIEDMDNELPGSPQFLMGVNIEGSKPGT